MFFVIERTEDASTFDFLDSTERQSLPKLINPVQILSYIDLG